jgi:glycosyltransferase involved in cell wall biosynthesis
MRIGVDARMFGPRVGGGGLGRYVEELLNELTARDDGNDYVVFLKKDNFHAFSPKNHRVQKVLADVHWYGVKEQIVMPKLIRRAGVDLMFFPHWNVPLACPVPFVVTIHDLILLEDPQSARSTTRGPLVHALKTAGFRVNLAHATKRSRHIIAVSDVTKRALVNLLGVPARKITTIHHGVKQYPTGEGVSLRALGVQEPYFLMVGNSYPHKNHQLALQAFLRMRKHHPHVQLVCAGRVDVFAERIEAAARSYGLTPEHFRYVHLPTDEELGALYRGATAFLFPSRIEGFGWPPLEAMLAEVPALVSDIPIHHEILGNHATFLPLQDVTAWASALHQVIVAPPSPSVRAAARRYAVQFSWNTCAERTRDVLLTHIRRL